MSREEIIKNLMEGTLDPAEAERLSANNPEFASLRRIAGSSSKLAVPEGQSQQQAWEKLKSRLEGKTGAKVVPLTRYLYYALSAAAVLVVGFYFIFVSAKTLTTAPGERISAELPDGSTVILNAGSTLEYPRFMRFRRNVSLSGEAYFSVVDGTDFSVKTSTAVVHVLGTEFNVYARDERLEVHCMSGSVSVSSKGSSVTLGGGQRTHAVDSSLSQPSSFDAAKEAAWLNGDFYFQFARLEDVVRELERQFNVNIALPDSARERLYTGYFSNRNLDEALQLVFLPLSLEYTVDGSIIIIQ
jgi:ferric-dicitrate binding protein FerR (iron transport regulator)